MPAANHTPEHQANTPVDWARKIANEAPDLRGAALEGADFSRVDLPDQDFRRAILRNAKFIGCDLSNANFADADLSGANFRAAKLENVDFSNANLSRANFYQASLLGAVLIGSNLYSTNFREATMGQTTFANLEMATCIGLETVCHKAPSSVAVECLYRSGNNLPMQFLEGVGFSKILLQYLPDLVSAGSPIQFHSCFISYSHTDEAFARRLWLSMRNERIRVWYAPEEMKAGRKLFDQIDRAIQLHDKLLIVLSKESISSNWVETEIRRARRQEKLRKERKLFPIRLCDMKTLQEWQCFDTDSGRDIAEEIREYFIPDFSDWLKPGKFEEEFAKLSEDLRLEGVQLSSAKTTNSP
jgi:uncharacterized protein YjbI with pentapeptide repeats